MHILLLLCVWFFFLFVTGDFKTRWFPRFGRDDRVRERRPGLFSQEPHPGKLKPSVVPVQPAQRPVGVNLHRTAAASVQVGMGKVKFPEDRVRHVNGR